MSEIIHLVQGDANVDIQITLVDKDSGLPVDVSAADIALYYKKVGAAVLTDTIVCSKPNGGADGFISATLTAACMVETGAYDGEFEVTIGAVVQTVHDKQRFRVRPQLEV